jgi:hypothetical protein
MTTEIEAVQRFLAWKEEQALTVLTDVERYEEHLRVTTLEAKLAEIKQLLDSNDAGDVVLDAIEEVLNA